MSVPGAKSVSLGAGPSAATDAEQNDNSKRSPSLTSKEQHGLIKEIPCVAQEKHNQEQGKIEMMLYQFDFVCTFIVFCSVFIFIFCCCLGSEYKHNLFYFQIVNLAVKLQNLLF